MIQGNRIVEVKILRITEKLLKLISELSKDARCKFNI
jgi:hypothetical protein